MKTFEKNVRNYLQGKKVLLLFIVTNIIYALMLTITIPNVTGHAEGMKLLDMMPTGYDLEYVSTLFEVLGQEGRETYLYQQIPLDMLYPGLFAITYSLILAYFLNKMGKIKTPFSYLCILPFIVGSMDYVENIGIIYMLTDYPEISDWAVSTTSSFSLLKSVGTTLYFVILLVVLIVFGIKVLGKR